MNTFNNSRKIEHPNYRSWQINYDYALLQMQNGFDLPNIPNVAPACLPTGNTPSNVEVRRDIIIDEC